MHVFVMASKYANTMYKTIYIVCNRSSELLISFCVYALGTFTEK